MKSWFKTFAIFISLLILFIFGANNYIDNYASANICVGNNELTISLNNYNNESFIVTQNIKDSFISAFENNSNNCVTHLFNTINNSSTIKTSDLCLYNIACNRIFYNISPNLEYAIYVRAP